MSNVLVTGGAGYIGSHVVKALIHANHNPVIVDDLSTGHEESIINAPLICGDFGDTKLVRKVIKEYRVTAVIHLAACAYVGESIRMPHKYFRNNVTNNIFLLESMLEEAIPTILFASSCATYGTPTRVPIEESEEQRPINPYGRTKLMFEQALEWYGEAYGVNWIAFRCFNVAGADPDGVLGERHNPETHLIPLLIQSAMGSGKTFELNGYSHPTADGSTVRDFVHVTDIAEAFVLGLDYLDRGGRSMAINLGSGCGFSVNELIRRVQDVTGGRLLVHLGNPRRGDPPQLIADIHRASSVLGWSPKTSHIEEIINTSWQWFSRLTSEGIR